MKHASDTPDTYLLIAYQSLSRIFIKCLFVTVFFSHTFFPLDQPLRKVCIVNQNIGQFCLNNLVLYSVLFRFGHIRRWVESVEPAVYILYSGG